MKALLVATLLAAAALAAPPPPPEGTIQVDAKSIVWSPGSPKLPKGTMVAVLEGDPTKAGMFTMRLKVPAGSKIAPHWHPRPERVTILSGQVEVGFGDRWDDKALRPFTAGSFYVNPPNSHHFVHFAKTSVIQITGDGPWELHAIE
jgi:hypothetical protein